MTIEDERKVQLEIEINKEDHANQFPTESNTLTGLRSAIVKGSEVKPVYTREQLRKQIEVGLDCAHANGFYSDSYDDCGEYANDNTRSKLIEFMTSHLWGTLGMLLDKEA